MGTLDVKTEPNFKYENDGQAREYFKSLVGKKIVAPVTGMDAVATKTSKHSATNRNAIVSAYVMCNIDKITKDE